MSLFNHFMYVKDGWDVLLVLARVHLFWIFVGVLHRHAEVVVELLDWLREDRPLLIETALDSQNTLMATRAVNRVAMPCRPHTPIILDILLEVGALNADSRVWHLPIVLLLLINERLGGGLHQIESWRNNSFFSGLEAIASWGSLTLVRTLLLFCYVYTALVGGVHKCQLLQIDIEATILTQYTVVTIYYSGRAIGRRRASLRRNDEPLRGVLEPRCRRYFAIGEAWRFRIFVHGYERG